MNHKLRVCNGLGVFHYNQSMTLPHEFLFELHKHFTGDIHTDTANKVLYSTDASIYQIEPLGVVLPRTQEDLMAAVELAAKYHIPILPRGAGTSLAGQAVGEALILDCSRWLHQIVEIDSETHTATVEPGVVLSTLNRAALKHGLMFGPDPASAERATMGGVIANNATGAHSIVYGMSADHLISADVILADGSLETWDQNGESKLTPVVQSIRTHYAEIIKQRFPKSWRNSAGYRLNYLLPWSPSIPPQWSGDDYPANLPPNIWNLAHLLSGSEGTLAVMQRAKVNLVSKPKETVLGILTYASIGEACDDVPRLLGFNPSAVELIPQLILRLAKTVPAYARQMDWIEGDPAAILVIEFSGDQIQHLRELVKDVKGDVVIAETQKKQTQIWNIRKVGLGILDSRAQSERPIAFIEDCAIPVENLGDFVREVEKILAAYHTYGGIYAHASGGCLHIRPILDLRKIDGIQAMREIAEATLILTLSLGGSMSSEHGDGIARSEWLQKIYGDDLIHAMRMLKQTADPHNLLNPGKLFSAPKMDSNLRYDAGYHTQTWKPALDFSRNGGLTLAIEQCNGQGVCRKDTGIMCPSYQATRAEKYSTRGRANLLRALITSGTFTDSSESDLTDAVADALDLCLACKGCKAECPSGVDMAKLKYEFEHHYYKTHSRPWRDYVFGYFHIVVQLASTFPSLSNGMMSNHVIKNALASILQITPRRPFPIFNRRPARLSTISNSSGHKVIFLADPLTRYVDPQVEQAALDVLSMCGYDVRVLPLVGAGASLHSKGFIDSAKRYAQKMVREIMRLDPNGEAAIVGIEPPEVFTLKHDYHDLVPDQADQIASLSARTWLLDEYLIRSEKFLALTRGLSPSQDNPMRIKFQPHCHQRAEGPSVDGLPNGVHATLMVLRACGYDVDMIDAGCCGMAGTFGYEAEHYELSMKIGDLRLFPIIQQLKTQGDKFSIVSTGAACRMQIQQGVGDIAQHPVVLVKNSLERI